MYLDVETIYIVLIKIIQKLVNFCRYRPRTLGTRGPCQWVDPPPQLYFLVVKVALTNATNEGELFGYRFRHQNWHAMHED